jgi:Sulfotransferase family
MSGDLGPIFIGGLSHTGKTQLRIALGAHPAISMTRRTYMWDRFYERFGGLEDPRHLERCLSAMLRDTGVRGLDPDPARIRREFLEGPLDYAHLFGLFHRHHAERMGKRRWGEQLGSVERYADQIFAGFPTARMIHMVRDPRDGGAARRGGAGWRTAMWLRSADLAERNRRRHGDRYRVVRYETLASRPSEIIRELCCFLQEWFVPEMEAALDAISFDPAGGGDLGSAAGSWSPSEVAFVESYAGPRMPALGYPSTVRMLSPRERVELALVDRPLNRATAAAWRVLEGRSTDKRVRSHG